MPRSDDQNAAIRDQQAQRIREAAVLVFARHGYAGARMAEIAAGSGVSAGLIHHYFESKENLFIDVISSVLEAASELPRQALAMPGTAWSRLTFLVTMMVEGARARPEYFLLLQGLASESAPAAARQLVAEKGAGGLLLMAELVEQGQAEGSVRPGDPRALMMHVIAAIEGAASHLLYDVLLPGFPDATVILGLLAAQRGTR